MIDDTDHLDILGELEELDSLDEMSLLGDLMGLTSELEDTFELDDITVLQAQDKRCTVCNYEWEKPEDEASFSAWLWETAGDKRRMYNSEWPFTAEEMWKHWRYHYRAQPEPQTRLLTRDAWARFTMLTPRQKEIIRCAGRVRMLSTVMVAQLFYAKRKPLERWHLDQARRDLTTLASMHYLYRYRVRDAKWNSSLGSTVWYLGKAGQMVLSEEQDAPIRTGFYIRRESEIKPLQLPHDLTANWLYARAAMQLDGASYRGGQFIFNPQNWFGARQLHMGYMDPYHYLRRDSVPDGLFAIGWERDLASSWMATLSDDEIRALLPLIEGLSIEDVRTRARDASAPPTDLASAFLPCFLEYDRGTKKAWEVADQVLSYAYISSSNVAAKLLPQVGGMVPAVMVFRSRSKLSEVRKVLRKRLASLRERGVLNLWAPVYLTTEDLWNTKLLDGKILVHAWHGKQAASFSQVLFAENKAALSSAELHSRSILVPDKNATKLGQETYRELPARPKPKVEGKEET